MNQGINFQDTNHEHDQLLKDSTDITSMYCKRNEKLNRERFREEKIYLGQHRVPKLNNKKDNSTIFMN